MLALCRQTDCAMSMKIFPKIQVNPLQHLQILRIVIGLAQMFSLMLGYRYLAETQAHHLVGLVIGQSLVILFTQGYLYQVQLKQLASNEFVMLLHLLIDCGFLTMVLYQSGGATNPFASYYLVPVALSAATLSLRYTAFLTAVCMFSYMVLMFHYQPLQALSPHADMMLYSDQHEMHMTTSSSPGIHVFGMALNFGLSALLITWFVSRMAHALHVRDADLAAMRESCLRDEQLLGIATLAAGTAHELATPLASIAIIAEDMQSETANHPGFATETALLVEQVSRCKTILQNLARAAEQQQSGALHDASVHDYLSQVLSHWQLLCPAVPVKINSAQAHGEIQVDATLEQALINLLNNAAEASPAGIEASWSTLSSGNHGGEVCMNIRDYGSGISLDADKLGKPFVSTRGQGRGLGLFIANAAIERLRGKVTLQEHPQGGTVTTVILPCKVAV
jgi:two-component system sensor histidine kinase RegB